jgi:hypothetical protein
MPLLHASRKPLFLAVLLLGLLASAGRADKVPKGKFQLWGGNCSRSYQLRSAHDSVLDAAMAAHALRKGGMRRVEIIAAVPEGHHFGKKPAGYTVYTLSCRSGRAVATTDFFWRAALVQASLGGSPGVEIVTHYQAP